MAVNWLKYCSEVTINCCSLGSPGVARSWRHQRFHWEGRPGDFPSLSLSCPAPVSSLLLILLLDPGSVVCAQGWGKTLQPLSAAFPCPLSIWPNPTVVSLVHHLAVGGVPDRVPPLVCVPGSGVRVAGLRPHQLTIPVPWVLSPHPHVC